MVTLKELEIKNCLSLSHVFLHFESNNYTTIFNYPPAYKLKNKILQAIQPFFCKAMSRPMEGKPNTKLGSSYVRIKFLMRKEEGERSDVVDAMRLSAKPSEIFYYFNEEQYIEPIEVFHERCQLDVSSFYPFLNKTNSVEKKNLLNQWVSSKCPLRRASEKTFELLADYLESPMPNSVQQIIANITQTNLLIDRECELLTKRSFVNVANDIGGIFNSITFGEYIVKFIIPLCGENLNVQEVKWEDMNLNKVETRVKRTGASDPCLWNQLEPGLKKLLEISRTIALAKHLKQKVIFMEDAAVLQEYQNQEMIKEAIIQKSGVDIKADWEKKNFIKQIVDVCHKMEISLFINYHGVLSLRSPNANVIKCRDPHENDGKSIYICSDHPSLSLDDFLALFSQSNSVNISISPNP